MFNFIKHIFKFKAKPLPPGPNNLTELLAQFNEPKKVKTADDIVKEYTIKETMASLELSFLKDSPAMFYKGNQSWYDNDGNKFFDFVPCALRPEVTYCCYGKN
jgi:hypothetical protein